MGNQSCHHIPEWFQTLWRTTRHQVKLRCLIDQSPPGSIMATWAIRIIVYVYHSKTNDRMFFVVSNLIDETTANMRFWSHM